MQNAERIPFSCNGIWTKEIKCSKYRPLTKKLKIILKCKTVFQLSIRQKQNRKSRLFLVPKASSPQFLELRLSLTRMFLKSIAYYSVDKWTTFFFGSWMNLLIGILERKKNGKNKNWIEGKQFKCSFVLFRWLKLRKFR